MKPKFTPGPWHIERRHPDPETNANLAEIFPAVGGCHGEWSSQEICSLHMACAGSIQEANARLIAAAPELLEALKRAVQHVPANAVDAKAALSKPVAECRTLDFCEQVIAKAEGRK